MAHRARAFVAHPAGAVAGLVADGLVPPVALAAAVLVASAGLGVTAHVALVGLKHLAVAYALDVALRRLPRHRLAAAGRRLRTAAAVGLLWLAVASFGAGQAIAPRPTAAATVPAAVADFPPSSATVGGPDNTIPPPSSGAPARRRATRSPHRGAEANGRA